MRKPAKVGLGARTGRRGEEIKRTRNSYCMFTCFCVNKAIKVLNNPQALKTVSVILISMKIFETAQF